MRQNQARFSADWAAREIESRAAARGIVFVCTVTCQTINADRVIDTREQELFTEKTQQKLIL